MKKRCQPPKNINPDLLYMELDIEERDDKQIDLLLLINFNVFEYPVEEKFNFLTIGLRRGELRMNLTNGLSKFEERRLFKKLPYNRETEHEVQSSKRNAYIEEGKVSASVKEILAASKGSTKNIEDLKTETDTYPVLICDISTKGTPEDPVWRFAQTNGVLMGMLEKQTLATINILEKPLHIYAFFWVLKKNFKIVLDEGDEPLSPFKEKLIQDMLAQELLKNIEPGFLSSHELVYE